MREGHNCQFSEKSEIFTDWHTFQESRESDHPVPLRCRTERDARYCSIANSMLTVIR